MSRLNIPSMENISQIQSLYSGKCTIASLDEPPSKREPITVMFNPSKIKFDKNVPWERQPSAGSKVELLGFTGAKSRNLSLELFFDGYANVLRGDGRPVKHKVTDTKDVQHTNVEKEYIDPLLDLTKPSIPVVVGGKQLRPPFVVLVWGELSQFKGVLESVNAEYSMFASNGCPVRATCTVKLAEIDMLQLIEQDKSASQARGSRR